MNVLVTGGRAPYTLALIRMLRRAGHDVFCAESQSWYLSQFSHYLKKSIRVPSPRIDFVAYRKKILATIAVDAIDLLIPTCEEVFYLSAFRHKMNCHFFCVDHDTLIRLHDKLEFSRCLAEKNLPIARSKAFLTVEKASVAARDWKRNVVFKPIFSRFSAHVVMHRIDDDWQQVKKKWSKSSRWMMQEFIDGDEFCLYVITKKGRVVAEAIYRKRYCVGLGASSYFEATNDLAITRWNTQFFAQTDWTGQFSFDLILRNQQVYAIECNPRLTSGIHLFEDHPEFVNACIDSPESDHLAVVLRPSQNPKMITAVMILFGLPKSIIEGNFKCWLRDFKRASDVIYHRQDPLPWLGQFFSLAVLFYKALWQRKSIMEISTHDIEWNGETLRP